MVQLLAGRTRGDTLHTKMHHRRRRQRRHSVGRHAHLVMVTNSRGAYTVTSGIVVGPHGANRRITAEMRAGSTRRAGQGASAVLGMASACLGVEMDVPA